MLTVETAMMTNEIAMFSPVAHNMPHVHISDGYFDILFNFLYLDEFYDVKR